MPDLTEFEALGATRVRNRCTVGVILDQLEGADRDNLEGALAASHIGPLAIVRWCKARGAMTSDKSVRNHRNGACCCA